jgi:ApaG protein
MPVRFPCEVIPQFLPDRSAPDQGIFGFAYAVTVATRAENRGATIVTPLGDLRQHRPQQVRVAGWSAASHFLKPGRSFNAAVKPRLATTSGTMQQLLLCRRGRRTL